MRTEFAILDEGSRVQFIPFKPALIPQAIMSVIQPVQRAQVVRPWLPELLPQFEHFVWLDSDTWVQNNEFMGQMIAGANAAPEAVTLAPAHSHYHARVYLELHEILATQLTWYTTCYEPYLANKAASSLSYSSVGEILLFTNPILAGKVIGRPLLHSGDASAVKSPAIAAGVGINAVLCWPSDRSEVLW